MDPHRALHAGLNLPQAAKPRTRSVLGRIVRRLRLVVSYPDATMGWKPFALDAIRNIDGPFDAILSTGPPITEPCYRAGGAAYPEVSMDRRLRDLWATNLDNPPRWSVCFDSRIEYWNDGGCGPRML